MTREEITTVLLQNADRLKAMGAVSLYMFGSRARGDNRPDSDLDLFYDLDESRVKSYLDFVGFELDLQDKLGLPVQMGARTSLDPIIKEKVERQAIRVF